MIHELASQLGGDLAITSKPGVGTFIEMHLSASDGAVAQREPAGARRANKGAGAVLLVDDEELVRASTADMLADLGYLIVEGVAPDLPRLVKPFRQADLVAKFRELQGTEAR